MKNKSLKFSSIAIFSLSAENCFANTPPPSQCECKYCYSAYIAELNYLFRLMCPPTALYCWEKCDPTTVTVNVPEVQMYVPLDQPFSIQ